MIIEAITINPDQTDPKGAILSRSFAIFDTKDHIQTKWTKQKCLTSGKRGKFVYLACPTNPLKGPGLSTLNFRRTFVFGVSRPFILNVLITVVACTEPTVRTGCID